MKHPNRLLAIFLFLFASNSVFAQNDWERIVQFDAARVFNLIQSVTDSSQIFASVYEAGIWKSNDGGESWFSISSINTKPTYHGLAVATMDHNKIIFISYPTSGNGAETGVFLTNDGGYNWQNLDNQFPEEFPKTLAFAPSENSIVYAAGDSLIYRSNNGGLTWDMQNNIAPLDKPINDIEVDLNNPDRLIISTWNYIAISEDGGQTWHKAGFDNVITYNPTDIEIVDDTLMVAAAKQGLLISTDNGNNWSGKFCDVISMEEYPSFFYVAVDRYNYDHILISSYRFGIYQSYDKGDTWTPFTKGIPTYFGTTNVLSISENKSKIIAGGYQNGIYVSEAGADWTRLDQDFQTGTGECYAHLFNPERLYRPIGGLGIFRSEDKGQTWQRINNQLDDYEAAGWDLAFHPNNPDTIYFTTNRGVFRSNDGGDNWEWKSVGLPDSTGFWEIVINSIEPNYIYIYSSNSWNIDFYRSSDGSNTWDMISTLDDLKKATAVAPDPHQSGHLIVSGRNGWVFESFDHGETWSELVFFSDIYYVFRNIVFDPYRPGIIYGSISSNDPSYNGIWRSDDNGQNWHKQDTNYPMLSTFHLNVSSVDTFRLFTVTSQGGVFLSEDEGKTWTADNDSLESLSAFKINLHTEDGSDRLYYGSRTGLFTKLMGPPNTPPVITLPTTSDTTSPGEDYSFTPTIEDAEQDNVLLVLTEGPAWMSVVNNEYLGGSPGNSNTGEFEIFIRADDLFGGITDTSYMLTVLNNTPPIPVTDLQLKEEPTETSLWLKWTAPGAHWDEGTVSVYDLRYSETAITESNFNSASIVSSLPTPGLSRSKDSVQINGLSNSTQYYFALKSSNSEDQTSSISNVVSAITAGTNNTFAPEITSHGFSEAEVDSVYQYNENNKALATGTMPITWGKISGPDNFIIDTDGNVSWTPNSVDAEYGSVLVILRATNDHGSDDDSITVVFSDTMITETVTSDTIGQFLDFSETGVNMPDFCNDSDVSGTVTVSKADTIPEDSGTGSSFSFTNQYWVIDSSIPDDDFSTTLVFYYDESALNGTPEDELIVVHRKNSEEQWTEYYNQELDTLNNIITLYDVTEFSSFAPVDDLLTSLFESQYNSIAHQFQLHQNYPNPFNPITNIRFYVPISTSVKIYIYNILGQKVKSLVNKNVNAGLHEVIWDGRDENGNLLPSGLYIYSMTANNYQGVKKLLLLK